MWKSLLWTSIALASVVLLSACGGTKHWETNNISGLMPDLKFTLTEDNGQSVHADAFRGKVKLLYFGYTHCPDICPITLGHLAAALRSMGKKADQVRVLFVSVDPNRDSPALLKTYTQAFGSQFVGLTGTQDQLHALAKRYRVAYSYGNKYPHDNYVVNHSSAIFVFDRAGHIRLLMNYKDPTRSIAHDLKQLVD